MPFSTKRHTQNRFFLALLILSSINLTSLDSFAQVNKSSSRKKQALEKPSITLLAAGDIADCRQLPAIQTKAEQTAQLISKFIDQDPNTYVVTLGDNTYPIGRPAEFSECYDKTWGKFKSKTLPSPGNHDYGVPFAAGYYNYFDELAGPDRRGYYRRQIGNWLILSLNSNIKGEAMQAQLNWLTAELKSNAQPCLLAFWHHPVVSSGGHGNVAIMRAAWDILVEAKADIVLASHDHHYERFVPLDKHLEQDTQAGIHSFVVGTGGAKLSPLFFSKPTTAMRQNDQHGILKLELKEKSFRWQFIATGSEAVLDRGEANCH
ncbi:metallophosphoesterase family protein [Undibacterium fentianense]|uniref:Metallophosphoesterase n=1 Tax=Undibacterium fentianense TaxID=2828728 RepID=A0A941IG39_9BURK|nr:metallophosphoesterase family protein [Undibacterium fentianense]MBR7800987.1 metallophosphoesterase [Undibacterium fentianense]